MPFWPVHIKTYCINFLTPSFVIYINKHHHQGEGQLFKGWERDSSRAKDLHWVRGNEKGEYGEGDG
jgi:hypothetical protein